MKNLLPYQSKWINDNSKIKLIEKSRQIGISYATSLSLVLHHSKASTKLDSWVSSQDHTQAKLFLQDCSKFASSINLASSSLSHPILHHSLKPSSNSLHFSNNSSINALSSSINAQAGKRGPRILDEFALHPDPELLYQTSFPGITWGGNLQIISTHRSHNNFFNSLIQEITLGGNPKNISHHKVTLQDALDQGFLSHLKLKLHQNDPIQSMDNASYFDSIKSSCPDYDAFLQEYMCVPTDESSFFIPPSTIDLNIASPSPLLDFQHLHLIPNPLFLGIDLARSNDLSVFALLENINNTFFLRSLVCLKNTPFDTQAAILEQFLSLPNLTRASIDKSGLGLQFTEQAIQKYSPYRVQGLNFSQHTKEYLAYLLKFHLENFLLRLPNDPLLLHDLRAIKRSYTQSGQKFDAQRTSSGHADRFWALALALHAAKSSPGSNLPNFNAFNNPNHFNF